MVIPVPDSSVPAAIGYARASGLPYNDGFIKNRYIGRTFIQPTDSLRQQGVALKFNVLDENLRGKRRGGDRRQHRARQHLRPAGQAAAQSGAREVHVRITCPPIAHPCFMGVDMGSYDELIAHRMTSRRSATMVDGDSLHFLSLDGMMRALGRKRRLLQRLFHRRIPLEAGCCTDAQDRL